MISEQYQERNQTLPGRKAMSFAECHEASLGAGSHESALKIPVHGSRGISAVPIVWRLSVSVDERRFDQFL